MTPTMTAKCPLMPSGGARLALFGAYLACACAASPRGGTAPVAALEEIASASFPPGGPGGVVLVARHGQTILERGYGLADVELGVPMRPDHVLAIGSITKQFTAVGILTLVEEGRLTLEDDVRSWVPEADTGGATVTIEELLTHTSGLPNLVDRDDFEARARLDHTTADLLALTHGLPLAFEPGTGFAYSDSGYILLGAVIERVSGSSYGDFVEERLARPLGLASTCYGHDGRIVPRRARGYSFVDGRVANAAPISMTVPHAAGGLLSTAGDLLRWDSALRAGSVVAPELLRRAWSARVLPDGTHSGYGFGWKVCELAGHRTLAHGGFVNGFGAYAMSFPDDGLNVVVLVNNDSDSPDAGLLARRLARSILTGSDAPAFVTLTRDQRRALVGRYELASGDVRAVFERSGTLWSRRNLGEEIALAALSPTELTPSSGDGDYKLEFELAADGTAIRMRTSIGCEPVDTATRAAGPVERPGD